jgi:hypothetical protein
MSDTLDFKIRQQLADYLAGNISLRQFEDWFFAETWDIEEAANQALMNLVYEIKLRLAEFSHGDWTEVELRSMLHSILEKHVIAVGNTSSPYQPQVSYGTTSKNYPMSMPIVYSGQHVGIVPSRVYV